jgi:hypothetical protein
MKSEATPWRQSADELLVRRSTSRSGNYVEIDGFAASGGSLKDYWGNDLKDHKRFTRSLATLSTAPREPHSRTNHQTSETSSNEKIDV